jgi:hypothetical protein
MKKILKWTGIVLGLLLIIGFVGFLYFIPPFTLVPPEEFSKPTASAGPSLDDITDPAERALALRGKYLVTGFDCSGCHTPLGDQGPNWNEYLAGGIKTGFKGYGTYTSRNLTPDKENGLARRTDDQVKRVLRSGLLPEGRVAHYQDMPWALTSNWTEEDRYAVLIYLRHLKPVAHTIPDPDQNTVFDDPAATHSFFNTDFGHSDVMKK